MSLGLVLKVLSLALVFGLFSSLKVIENKNLKEIVTSFYKLLLWPTFQDIPMIKQTIGSRLWSRFFEERLVSCTQHWGSVFSNHV